MKIDRLIGILSILLQQEKVTAPMLAEKFEVSRRTINRDIEDLCKAGIPLVTVQGKNGGIAIMEGYRMDKTLLTSSEMQAIFAGLKSLDSISLTKRYRQLMDKLLVVEDTGEEMITIDLSSYDKSTLPSKFELIKGAIESSRLITFDYFGPTGEGERTIEPYVLVFQWSSWYVKGYCRKRDDYRMFKLSRMEHLRLEEERYEIRKTMKEELDLEKIYPVQTKIKAVFDPSVRWRLVDDYGMETFRELEDGKLLFQFGFSDRDSLFGWLLGFGNKAELLEPAELRGQFAILIHELAEKYPENYEKESKYKEFGRT